LQTRYEVHAIGYCISWGSFTQNSVDCFGQYPACLYIRTGTQSVIVDM